MANHGWECPKCGRVYAPWQWECRACNKATDHVSQGGATITIPNSGPCPSCGSDPCNGTGTGCAWKML